MAQWERVCVVFAEYLTFIPSTQPGSWQVPGMTTSRDPTLLGHRHRHTHVHIKKKKSTIFKLKKAFGFNPLITAPIGTGQSRPLMIQDKYLLKSLRTRFVLYQYIVLCTNPFSRQDRLNQVNTYPNKAPIIPPATRPRRPKFILKRPPVTAI